jgi:uncharacterized protein involved in propanediol utilization
MNQILRPKRLLAAVTGICGAVGGLGVAAAHSGTMLGVLLDTRHRHYVEQVAETVHRCSALLAEVSLHRTLTFD